MGNNTNSELVENQQTFFFSNATKDIHFRIKQLRKLKDVLIKNEDRLYLAVYNDFKKSKFDTFTTELALVYKDIDVSISKIKKWSRRKKVRTNALNFPAKSYIIPEPLGNTLIIGAWNYPYLLLLGPAIAAITAGNTVVLKPSEIAPHSSKAIAKIINSNFQPEFLHVVEGGIDETTELLAQKWDKIFFTGSSQVGRIVYQTAAKNLTPVTLELGGKSPAFVTNNLNLEVAVSRIVWGKFLNAGQTCIAPDYVLVDKKIQTDFLEKLKDRIKEINYSADKGNYTQIVSDKHYQRLIGLYDKEKIYFEGENDSSERIIMPTILNNIDFLDKIMQEEIFGPILPVIAYDDLDFAIQEVKKRPKPLALYVFTNDKSIKDKILSELSFGGGAVNDVLMHISNQNLPFGGVGESGIGNYRGKAGFDTFSHQKSILEKATWIDPKIRYGSGEKVFRIMKKMIKL